MDTTSNQVEGACRHHHTKESRRAASARAREELLAEYKNSGLTQKAFAVSRNVNFHTFVSWLAHSRLQSSAPQRTPARVMTPGFVELSAPALGAPHARLEILLRDGRVVRGDDARALATLARLLED